MVTDIGSGPYSVVFKGNKETDLFAYFLALGLELTSIPFIYYDGAEYMRSIKETLPDTRIMVHIERQGLAEKEVLFKGKTYHELRDFIISTTHPQVMEARPTTMQLVHDNHFPALFLHCHHVNDCQPYIQLLNNSNAHNHKLLKIYKFNTEQEHHTHDDPTNHDQPTVCIMDTKRGKLHHHWFRGELTAENLEAFIERYFHYRPHPHHFSEHPEDYHHTAAKAITGHNYHREVELSKRPMVLLVHHGYENETSLVESFTAAAQFLHRYTCHAVKFRQLNQRKNLTPLGYQQTATLVFMPLGNTDPDHFIYLSREDLLTAARLLGGTVATSTNTSTFESLASPTNIPITRWELITLMDQYMHVPAPKSLLPLLPKLKAEHLRVHGHPDALDAECAETGICQPTDTPMVDDLQPDL